MLRDLYSWTLAKAEHPQALWVLAAVAFIESSVFPIPPDVLMIPMILARPRRAWLIALVATAASVLGGVLGYGIGYFFYDQIGQPILDALGKGDAMAEFNIRFNDLGFWAVLTAGITSRRTGPLSAVAESAAPYAVVLETGSSKMAERPYMKPAARIVKEDYVINIRAGVNRVIRKG